MDKIDSAMEVDMDEDEEKIEDAEDDDLVEIEDVYNELKGKVYVHFNSI
jgi:hypothetical protein